MSLESSTTALRERSRVTGRAGAAAPVAQQVTIPGTDVQLSNTQAALGGIAVLAIFFALARGIGGGRQGFRITDV